MYVGRNAFLLKFFTNISRRAQRECMGRTSLVMFAQKISIVAFLPEANLVLIFLGAKFAHWFYLNCLLHLCTILLNLPNNKHIIIIVIIVTIIVIIIIMITIKAGGPT